MSEYHNGLKAKYKRRSLNRFEERVREWQALDKTNEKAVDVWVSNLLSELYKVDQQRIDAKVDGSDAEHRARAYEDQAAIAEAGAAAMQKAPLIVRVKDFFTNRSR